MLSIKSHIVKNLKTSSPTPKTWKNPTRPFPARTVVSGDAPTLEVFVLWFGLNRGGLAPHMTSTNRVLGPEAPIAATITTNGRA